jgi:hypothetical protein
MIKPLLAGALVVPPRALVQPLAGLPQGLPQGLEQALAGQALEQPLVALGGWRCTLRVLL